ncbi:DUF4340 domain-containing protein [Spartinivicinus poritis]|uniref:DUF4340 domain-containing protein n=1 Tax=Spartinivicinus poritis TaxID=2994640 RepID=A0ABT5UHY6_9GAMM|nr:DUF4340 domain-containing protein [Spartinivicinus sp. A2-2]MDE1464654.1 DUF4340 domain-containing protein [Spartinivicinus sp. A2-2]
MAKLKTWLTGLLAIQLVLVVGLFWRSEHQQQQNIQQPLFGFNLADVTKVIVSDSDNRVTMSKSGDHWVLPELANLPANHDKLTDVLAKLESIQTGWPVATTTSSHERFDVSEDKFQRQVQLYQDDKLVGSVLVGTSPGFRKAHIRKPEDDAVYTAQLNSYELPVKGNDWLNKSLLAAGSVDNIKSIEGTDYRLEKSDDSWVLSESKQSSSNAANATKLDMVKAQQLATALANLQVQGVADKQPHAGADSKLGAIEVVNDKGKLSYQLTAVDDTYFIKRSDVEQAFTISKYDYERITQVGLSQLALQVEHSDKAVAESKKATDTQTATEGQASSKQPPEKVETSQSDEEGTTLTETDASKS